MRRSPAFASRLGCLALATAPLWGQTSPGVQSATLSTERAWTRFVFDRALLAGFEIDVDPAVDRLELEAAAPSGFVVDAAGANFEGLVRGRLHHPGGFTLRHRGVAVAIAAFDIVPGSDPLSLAVLDAGGHALFRGDQMHFDYDPASGRLRLDNVDLRLSPALAAELGLPALAGVAIARLELEATVHAEPGVAGDGFTDCSPAIWTGDVDVTLTSLYSVQQAARGGGQIALSIATGLQSTGTADVAWRRKFTGVFAPYDNDQHPYLIWNLTRIEPLSGAPGAPTAVRMIGQSALKHAFYATNTGCDCSGGQILWAPSGIGNHDTVPCNDVYGNSNNNDPNALGPRGELEAHSGLWVSTGSFFDPDGDGVCDPGGAHGNDCDNLTFASLGDRRLAVDESALALAGATYFVDAWYLVRDDVDIFDTMGWIEVTPTFGGSSWTFPAATSLALGSLLDAWVPRTAPPAGTSHERLDTGVGELSLAARASDLGGGQYHYEYALANHDFDRKVRSFRVPLPPGAIASNPLFRDLDSTAGNDWSVTLEAGAITFQATGDLAATALEWGSLYSFGFDVDASPAAGSTDVGALEQTPALLVAAPAVTPGGSLGRALFFDDFESGAAARWSQVAP